MTTLASNIVPHSLINTPKCYSLIIDLIINPIGLSTYEWVFNVRPQIREIAFEVELYRIGTDW